MQRVVNFGSVLQAWSMRELIRDATGVEAEYLDIEDSPALSSRRTIQERTDYDVSAAYPPGIFQRGKRWLITRMSSLNKGLILNFMKKELGLAHHENRKNWDCVVVGSDEVFNHSRGVRLQLHGDIKEAQKVISYAASCGPALAEDILPEDKELVRKAMLGFSAMSVRDTASYRYVSQLYDGHIYRHFDPVLLSSLRKRPHQRVALKRYLLVYAYGQRIRTAEEIDAIKSFAAEKGLKTVAVGGSQFWCDLYIPCSPFRLMDWFYYADYVVTDTFHGIIFSVINHRSFAAISRKTNFGKVSSLLESLGLEDRELKEYSMLGSILEKRPDYKSVDERLELERERTIAYLAEHLGENE